MLELPEVSFNNQHSPTRAQPHKEWNFTESDMLMSQPFTRRDHILFPLLPTSPAYFLLYFCPEMP